ncbi:hypothetical protein SCHPADRAFT_901817 [Schizopora paradoxa]|uniref:Secreted protein n=1 Tax=Schizopora paradoxa TaxID=27342 RepID=A0A0H2RWD3_9AGAM|nr:hypothetical protein SCHPADRAFT_901817 [Schizopora paradoxa]
MTGNYRKRTPLPLLQLLVLTATRLAEPIAYTQIFPKLGTHRPGGSIVKTRYDSMTNHLFSFLVR